MSAIGIVLIVLTLWDISYNAQKERHINEKAIKTWTFLFAENVRIALNNLMKENKMDSRFELFKSMSDELTGLKAVRVIRSKRTNEIFREINEKEIIPKLNRNIDLYRQQIGELERKLKNSKSSGEKEEIRENISYLEEDINLIRNKINNLLKPLPIDQREEPKDELDKEVLQKGKAIYEFRGDDARVLIPYTVKEKGCAEKSGCHKFAKTGDVLGAINMEFSIKEINEEIRHNNIEMAALWLMRIFIVFIIISLLLSFIITKNLKGILNTFKKVSAGDFSVRVPVSNDDEIGRLSKGFNRMTSSLEETKKELDRHLLELFTLYNISKTMNSTFEMEELLNRIVKDISESMKIDRIAIMLVTKAGEELFIASSTGFESNVALDFRAKKGKGIYGKVALTGKSILIDEVDKDSEIPPEDIFDSRINSILIVPFMRRAQVLGLICGYKDKPNKLITSDMQLFDSVAEHVCIALENARLFEETKMLAITDGLTGLFNKRYFQDKLEMEFERARRKKHDLSLILLDLDNFKFYNDTNGHPAGDALLQELAPLIQSSVRKIDIACRYGGEELAIILPETNLEGAATIADVLLKKINQHPFHNREKQPLGCVSASIGVNSFPENAHNIETLIVKADEALYKAKFEGKNRVITASAMSSNTAS